MKKICFALSILLLAGCARNESPVITMLDAADHNLNAIEESLKPECKTPAVMNEIAAVRLQHQSIRRDYTKEVSGLKASLSRLRLCFGIFVGIIVVFFLWAIKK